MKKQILVVTTNPHKLEEMQAIMHETYTLVSLKDIGYQDEIIEDKATFHEQVVVKVETLAKLYPNMIIIADDSGIEIEALAYQPGVLSARYKPELTNHERNVWICQQANLKSQYHAAFVCAIGCHVKHHPLFVTVNRCFGTIANTPSHDHGFGYDPIFIPQGYHHTFQALPREIKNQISHRAKAIYALMHYLQGVV